MNCSWAYVVRLLKAVSFGLACCPFLWADDLESQSINSGGGWTSNSESSSFTIIGETYQSTTYDSTMSPSTFELDLNSTVGLEMIHVEPGTFTMGSPESEQGRQGDETQHEVTLTQEFFLSKYEVTQAQYEAVMTGNTVGLNATPSRYRGNPNRPVEKVSYDDIQVFFARLNEQQALLLSVLGILRLCRN